MRNGGSCWLYRHAAVTFLVALALLVFVALLVAAGATTVLDVHVENLARSWRTDPVLQAAGMVTALGTAPFLVGAALVAALLVAWQGRRSEMILPFLPLAGEWGGNALIKGIFQRQRPTDEPWPPGLFGTDQFSFPSGHAMASMALYSLLVCWAWTWWPHRGRLVVTLVLALLPLAIGVSRIVLGAHWLSDVFGGWLAGIAVSSLVVLVWVRLLERRERTLSS